MPGHKAGWMLAKKVDVIKQGPTSPQPPLNSTGSGPKATSCRGSASSTGGGTGDETPASVGKGKGKAASRKKPTRKEFVETVKSYSHAEVVVDYKRLLVETMLGDTDTGCQWCLAKPMTRKIYKSWRMRLCEGCFYINVITKHACKSLNVDISHLPVQDVSRQGGVLHGVWKPAVQRLTDAKNSAHASGGRQSVEEMIAEYKDKKQAEKDAATEELAAYRERHFAAIFESIKVQYREIYDHHAKNGFRGCIFAGVVEKVLPEQLKLEWFMEPRQRAERSGSIHAHPIWSWKTFCQNDSLMKELRNIKDGEKWKDVTWVEKRAREKIAQMEVMFGPADMNRDTVPFFTRGSLCLQWDLPKCCMKSDVNAIVKRWHLQRARDGGVQVLIDKMMATNGKGLQCPWTGCYTATRAIAFGTLENYMDHFRLSHWDVFILGDTDWLIGHPSRWWPRGVLHHNTASGSGTCEGGGASGSSSDSFKQEVRQADWLQQWWPDRWKEENVQVLEKWGNGDY